jgi:glutamate-1-semialdehyde 2,1-aminomutase
MTDLNQSLLDRARQVIPGGVNSPVRAFRAVGGTPRFVKRAQGANFWDANDRRYIDYIGSWGPMILGHGHAAVVEAVQKAVLEGFSDGAPTEREIELAEALLKLVPDFRAQPIADGDAYAVLAVAFLGWLQQQVTAQQHSQV